MTKHQLVLASASPQRRLLLEQSGYVFNVLIPDAPEPNPAFFPDARAYVVHTAWLKARQVAEQTDAGVVLAADTVVALNGQIIGKPADRSDAYQILGKLSGSVHECLTGVCIWIAPDAMWVGGVDVTELRMRQLASAELEAYLDSNRWVDKAGAYAIQDPDPYVTIIRGSYSNVVGLPLELVNRLLHSVRHQTGASAG